MLLDFHSEVKELHFIERLIVPPQPPPIQYYRLPWDWEVGAERFNHPRTNVPAILNFQQLQHNWMNREWQEFWFGLNQTADHEKDVKAWNTYTNGKAFLTDGTGTDYYRNFIAGTNSDKPLPKIETKGCDGNVVCIDESQIITWMGKRCPRIVTMEITAPPPMGVTYETHPHLIHHATTLADHKCNPFPHLGGRNTGIPIYFPLTSKGPVYYPYIWMQKLPLGSPIPNPYFPPMP